MRIGNRNRLVSLQRQVETGEIDALYQPVTKWQTITKFWAALTFKNVDEEFAASQRYAKRTVTFQTSYRDVKETDRLLLDGNAYNVKGVKEIGYREGIEISAEWQD